MKRRRNPRRLRFSRSARGAPGALWLSRKRRKARPMNTLIPEPTTAAPIGLLAGSGRFHIVFAEKARQLGIPVVCVEIRHEESHELAPLTVRISWAGVARM